MTMPAAPHSGSPPNAPPDAGPTLAPWPPDDPRVAVRAIFPDAAAACTSLGGRWTVSVPGLVCVLGDGAGEAGAWDDAAEAVEQAMVAGWGAMRGRGQGRTTP